MKRRDFIKVAAIAPIVPLSILPEKDIPLEPPCGCDSTEEHRTNCEHLPLKMWTNQYDYVIAKSKEDAEKMLVEILYGKNAWRFGKIPWLRRSLWKRDNDHSLLSLNISEDYDRENSWGIALMPNGKVIVIYKDEIECDGWTEMSMDTTFPLYNEDNDEILEVTVKQYVEYVEEYYEECLRIKYHVDGF